MRRRVYLICLIAWVLTVPLPIAAAAPPLQEQYLAIYLKINDAEHLEKQGDFRGALDAFKDCYAKLAKIHKDNPDWETALVLHRMDDCKAKVLDLQPKADAQPATTPPATTDATNPSTNSVAPAPIDTSNYPDDVAALKKRLMDVETELAATKDSLKDSQGLVETYRAQLQTVNQQLQALKSQQSVDDRVGKLLSDNKALTDKLSAAEKQLDTIKTNPKSKLAQVQAQLKNLQDEFDESQSANKTLQQTITNLQQHLDQASSDLVVANQKLAAAGPGNDQYTTIKRENEVMREILTRELQEQARRDEAKRLAQEEFDNLKLKSKVLQEQIDILGSPMTPATSDEERTLLASMKTSGPDVTPMPIPTGNSVSIAINPTPSTDSSTNASPVTPTPDASATGMSTPSTTDNSTNTPPVTLVSNTTDPAPTTPTPTPDATATPPSPPATTTPSTDPTSTNTTTTPSTPTPTPDTSVATPSTPAPTPTTPDTSSSPVSPGAPNTPPPTPPPTPTPDTTSTAPSTPPPTPTDTTPTVTQVPPAETTVTDTTIKKADTGQDATQYSVKARLPDDMRDTAQQAADLFKNQRYDEAAAKYQSIIDKYPESLYAWSNLGVVRFQQGDLNDALKALQQAVKLSPTDDFSYSNLGIVYYQLGQYENAIDALNAAKALNPNDAKTRNYLGCACSQKGWQEVAEKEFRKAIELDPNFGDAHFNLALVYATEKPPLLELARQEYKKALDLGIAKDDRLEKLLKPQP